jgi:hypothetical protein
MIFSVYTLIDKEISIVEVSQIQTGGWMTVNWFQIDIQQLPV